MKSGCHAYKVKSHFTTLNGRRDYRGYKDRGKKSVIIRG